MTGEFFDWVFGIDDWIDDLMLFYYFKNLLNVFILGYLIFNIILFIYYVLNLNNQNNILKYLN